AYNLQVDSKQIVHGKISVIYEALNIRLQPQKEPNLIPLTPLPRPFSAFIDPLLELWKSLTKDNFKKRNLSIYLSTIKETQVIGSTTYPSYTVAVKLSSKEETFGSTNRIWPSRLHSTLTMLIFLLSTISNNTNLQIVTNHRQTVEMIQKIFNSESYKLDQLNKEDYPSLLKILRGSIGDQKVTTKLDPELKAQKPLPIYNLDINPKRFVYNAYTMELLNIL
ncbi:6339_t:CDS:1, partial [Gigaspora rosea]